MHSFRNAGVFVGAEGAPTQGIVDIDLIDCAGRAVLLTTSGAGGGVLAFGFDPGSPGLGLAMLDLQANPRPTLSGTSGKLATLEMNGKVLVVQTGIGLPTPSARLLQEDGTLGKAITLTGAPSAVSGLEALTVDGQALVVTTARGSGVVRTHRLTETGALVEMGRAQVPTARLPLADDVQITTMHTARGSFVLAASSSSDVVTAWRVDAQGQLRLSHQFSSVGEGIGFSQVAELRAVHAYGQDFVVIGGGLSSSVTVMRLGANGQLTACDHVMDSLASRFGGLAALEVAVVNGRPIVVAAGVDGGLTALMIQPDGRLLTLAVQADMGGLPLADVSALELSVIDGTLHIFAAGTREVGIAHLTLDLSSLALPLLGTALADTLTGSTGDDLMSGLAGDDVLSGGAGADVLQDGNGADTLSGQAGADTFVLSRDGALDRITDFEPGVDRLDLSAWGRLYDLSAVSILRLSDGAVVLQYGAERLIVSGRDGAWISDTALRAALEGTVFHLPTGNIASIYDKLLVQARVTGSGVGIAVLREDQADARVSGTYTRDSLTGNSHPNELFGYEGNDTLDGGGGADLMDGGSGHDVYIVDDAGDRVIDPSGYDAILSSVSLTAPRGIERVTLTGTAALWLNGREGNETLIGNTGANRIAGGLGHDNLVGGGGLDTLIGAAGNDTLSLAATQAGVASAIGGPGDDLYLVAGPARIVELAGEGRDTVQSAVSTVVPEGVEVLVLTGGALDATGNAADNDLVGNGRANRLTGLAGHDVLDGGGGIDTLSGGEGDDILRVDTAADVVIEEIGGGRDTVESTVSLTIAANIEVLRLIGRDAIDAYGSDRAEWLIGNEAANRLLGAAGNDNLAANGGGDTMDGGTGADTMQGGTGNDVYIVDDMGDRVIERPGAGTDHVFSRVSYWLPQEVEALTLSGSGDLLGIGNAAANQIAGNAGRNGLIGLAGNDVLKGGDGDDTLSGDEGDDFLSGGAGGDLMYGGTGNDSFVVDRATDRVAEYAGAGLDTVYTTISLTMPAHVERMVLRGAIGLYARGLAASDWIMGDRGHDTLVGAGGQDTLLGAGGNDVLSGDDGNDVLDGGAGRDTLRGGAGNDRLTANDSGDVLAGGLGDDLYIVTSGRPMLYELAGQGTDTVWTSVDLKLAYNFENASVLGSGNVALVGNAAANVLIGNQGVNLLTGGGGNDRLLGGAGGDRLAGDDGSDLLDGGTGGDRLSAGTGNDTLIGGYGDDTLLGDAGNDRLVAGAGRDTLSGGTGADVFVFDTAPALANLDRIADFRSADDALTLARGVFPGLAAGWQSAAVFVIGPAATTSAHRLIYNPANGLLSYDPDGNGRMAAQPIAALNPGTELHHWDIYVT